MPSQVATGTVGKSIMSERSTICILASAVGIETGGNMYAIYLPPQCHATLDAYA